MVWWGWEVGPLAHPPPPPPPIFPCSILTYNLFRIGLGNHRDWEGRNFESTNVLEQELSGRSDNFYLSHPKPPLCTNLNLQSLYLLATGTSMLIETPSYVSKYFSHNSCTHYNSLLLLNTKHHCFTNTPQTHAHAVKYSHLHTHTHTFVLFTTILFFLPSQTHPYVSMAPMPCNRILLLCNNTLPYKCYGIQGEGRGGQDTTLRTKLFIENNNVQGYQYMKFCLYCTF